MERWEILYNDSVDTIKFRQAGGMYNDIARKAFKAGVEAGIESQCLTGNIFKQPAELQMTTSGLDEGKTQCLSE